MDFLILIGGPAVYQYRDPADHDTNWSNFVALMQVAAQKDAYSRMPGELVHWLVFEPPYARRFTDDAEITKQERDAGKGLQKERQAAAGKVGKGGYLGRIQAIAKELKIKYVPLQVPDDLWQYIGAMKSGSISRFYYSGHAGSGSLFLSLGHDHQSFQAQAVAGEYIKPSDVAAHSGLRPKFSGSKPSKFYGCYTAGFAQTWAQTFGGRAEGAKNKVDFATLNQSTGYPNVLERMENVGARPVEWSKY